MKAQAAALACAFATLAAPSAHALEGDGATRGPFGAVHPEAAATVMASPSLPAFQYNAPGPVSGAWGLRGGASYLGFYGGLSFAEFPGESVCLDSLPGGCSSDNAMSFGAELGYGRTLFQWLLVRGTLNVGDYLSTEDLTSGTCGPGLVACSTSTSHRSSHNLYLEPGVLLGASLGPLLVGVDASWLYVPIATRPGASVSGAFSALMLGSQLGVRL
jgi:hypothetical protein